MIRLSLETCQNGQVVQAPLREIDILVRPLLVSIPSAKLQNVMDMVVSLADNGILSALALDLFGRGFKVVW